MKICDACINTVEAEKFKKMMLVYVSSKQIEKQVEIKNGMTIYEKALIDHFYNFVNMETTREDFEKEFVKFETNFFNNQISEIFMLMSKEERLHYAFYIFTT